MKTHQEGFTLVELLVVITIIGILAAIVTPSLMRGREAAQLTKCQQRMKEIFNGLQSYRASNQSSPPALGGEEATNWAMVLKDNGKGPGTLDNQVFFCPFTGRKPSASDDGDFMYNVHSEGMSALSSAAPTDLPLVADCVASNGAVSNHGKTKETGINVLSKDGSVTRPKAGSDLFKRVMQENMVGGANTPNPNCPPPAESPSQQSEEETSSN